MLALLAHPFVAFAFANLKHDLAWLWGWLCHRSFWQLAFGGVAIFALVQHFQVAAANRHSRKVETQLSQCTAARHADQEAYAKAQAESQAKNLADVARDKAARERITNDISQSYEAQLASLRADLARRLHQQNPAAPGNSGGSGLPNVSPAPSAPDGSTRLSVPTGLYVRGAELELQLEQLQQWVNQQLAVNPNAR